MEGDVDWRDFRRVSNV